MTALLSTRGRARLALIGCAVVLNGATVFAAVSKRLDVPPKRANVFERTVTMDVKDAEARAILKDMQKQCGIRNLLIDPQVQGTGTFLFNQVPCSTAFRVVLRSLGLQSVTYSNSVITVGADSH